METWSHNAPGDIIISWNEYIVRQYCSNTDSEWNCIEWIQVVPLSSLQNQYKAQAESNANVSAFIWVIVIFIRLIKWIFRLILPTRWKK